MPVPQNEVLEYVLYALENIGKVEDKLRPKFLENLFTPKNIVVDTDLLLAMELFDDYQKIKSLYNSKQNFDLYLTQLKKVILENNEQKFEGFPPLFKSFYDKLKTVKLNFTDDLELKLDTALNFSFQGVPLIRISTPIILCMAELNPQIIVCGCFNSQIVLIDSSNGQLLRFLDGHTNLVANLLIHNNQIVSNSGDKTIRYWNPFTGECTRIFNVNRRFDSIYKVNETTIMTSVDNAIILLGPENTPPLIIHDQGTAIHNTFLIDNKIIATFDNKLVIWDILGNKLKEINERDVIYVVNTETEIVYVTKDGILRIFDAKTLEFKNGLNLGMRVMGLNNIQNTIIVLMPKKLLIWDTLKNTQKIININQYNTLYVNNKYSEIILTGEEIGIFNLEGEKTRVIPLKINKYDQDFNPVSENPIVEIRDIAFILPLEDGRIAFSLPEELQIWR